MRSGFLLITLTFAAAASYFLYLYCSLSRKVQCRTLPYLRDVTLPVPEKVKSNPEKYVVYHECAQKSVPTDSLGTSPELLKTFLRHTLTTFSTYPPAWGLWYMIKDPGDRHTFDPAYIRNLEFVPGDRVCGVYNVSSGNPARIVLALDPPKSYAGPRTEGILIVEIRDERSMKTFMNHTVMWRELGKGSAGILESTPGRWMHNLMVKGLVESGVMHLLTGFTHVRKVSRSRECTACRGN